MAFNAKSWSDRLSEFPGRRRLKDVITGAEMVVDVTRAEGTVLKEGDAFSKENMDDLESRIKDAFDELGGSVADGKTLIASAITSKGVNTAATASFATMANNIKNIQTTPIVTSYSRSPGDASFKYTLFTADKNGTVSTYAYGHPGDGTASCYVRINGAIQSNGVHSINAGSVVSVEGTNNGSYTRTMYSVVYVRV